MKPSYVGTIVQLNKGAFGVKGLSPNDRAKLHDAIGPAKAYDVGKRVYRVGAILQVENAAQYSARIKKEA